MFEIDHLSALMHRLETAYKNLDLETDIGVVKKIQNYKAEERDVMEDLAAMKSRVAEYVIHLVEALRELDEKRASEETEIDGPREEREDVYVPERGSGLDRLLVKLDWRDMEMGI